MLDEIAWPPGYRYVFGGSTKNMNESFQYAVGALGLAIVFIYMILASQFKSFLQPLALMSALPLTLIGVVLTLVVVPVIYCYLDDLAVWARRRFGRAVSLPAPPQATPQATP